VEFRLKIAKQLNTDAISVKNLIKRIFFLLACRYAKKSARNPAMPV
jgi:hypothetical protein